jgi:hypothetical protein
MVKCEECGKLIPIGGICLDCEDSKLRAIGTLSIKDIQLTRQNFTAGEEYYNVLKIIGELLTLREAVAPQMAEVDALANTVYLSVESPAGIDISSLNRLADHARTAILACEKEKQRADEAEARYDRFLTEWFGDHTDFERLVDAAESHIDPDGWLSTECQRIQEIFLKRFKEQQNDRRED